MSEQFEERILKVLSQETQAPSSGPHLGERELRRLFRGRVRVKEFDRLGAHLASCAECRARYDAARVRRDESVLGDHGPRHVSRAPLILLRHAGVAVVVALIAAIVIAHGGPPRTTVLNGSGVALLARGAPSERPEAAGAVSSSLDAPSLVRSLHAFDNYPPSRAAAYTIGLLREYGVPLSSSALAFRAATVLVSEPGDTWESVAAKALGDPALWPIVILLNLELTKEGEFVPAGTYLRVPQPLPTEGKT